MTAGAESDRGSQFNDRVIAEFRAHRGRVGGQLSDTSVLLLHHLGARSGLLRVTPLAYNRLADGRLVIAASNGGSSAHPGWCHNVRANPQVAVEIGVERVAAKAVELRGAARAEAWPELAAAAPALAALQAGTMRQIPVFALTPVRPATRTQAS